MPSKEVTRKYRSSLKGKLSQAKYRITHMYNMTFEEYQERCETQNHVCYICNNPNMRAGKLILLSVDHNHTTGKVRKLLCYACNSALGFAKENPAILRKMADYLEM